MVLNARLELVWSPGLCGTLHKVEPQPEPELTFEAVPLDAELPRPEEESLPAKTKRRMELFMARLVGDSIRCCFAGWVSLIAEAAKRRDELRRSVVKRLQERGLAAALGGWRHHAAEQARLRRVADVAMRRIRNGKLGAAFERWAEHVAQLVAARRMAARLLKGALFECFEAWRGLLPEPEAEPPLTNPPGHWDLAISYTPLDAQAAALAADLCAGLRDFGRSVWLDTKMPKLNPDAMKEAARNSRCVLAVVTGAEGSSGYFQRDLCVRQLRWARDAGVPIQPVILAADKQRSRELLALAPDDLRRDLGRVGLVALEQSRPRRWKAGVQKLLSRVKDLLTNAEADARRRQAAGEEPSASSLGWSIAATVRTKTLFPTAEDGQNVGWTEPPQRPEMPRMEAVPLLPTELADAPELLRTSREAGLRQPLREGLERSEQRPQPHWLGFAAPDRRERLIWEGTENVNVR
eukprot:COSAG04_NODE_360_length_15920_cov_50.432815_14_plen_465_part_00